MPVRRDPRTKRWYFRTTVRLPDGTRRRVFGTPGVPGPYQDLGKSKVGAQEAERRAIAEAMNGKPAVRAPEERKVPTIQEYSATFLNNYSAADKPSAQLAKRQILNAHVLPFLGDVRLDELHQEDVDRFVAHLLPKAGQTGRSRKTVNNITAVLSSLVRYAADNKVIASPGLKFAIKTQNAEIFAVSAGDVDKLVNATPDERYRAAILLAADAGLRIGEIRALTWAHVNELARELSVAQSFDRSNELTATKGWKSRTVPISARLWAALKGLDRSRSWVIARQRGDAPLGYDSMRETVRRLYVAAAVTVPAKPWHSIRHTFGTELARASVPIHTIRALMGHESIETTLRYMHTDADAKRAAIAALWQPGGSGQQRGKEKPRKS